MGLSVVTLALAKKYTDEQIDNVSSSIPPDWNQNDENALDYIKNRPFYETYDWVEILNNPTINSLSGMLHVINSCPTLLENKIYKVIFNNEEYVCTGKQTDGDIYIGAIMDFSAGTFIEGEDEEIPFNLLNNGTTGLLSVRGDLPTNFIIYEQQTVVHKLDRKYIDYPIASDEDVLNALIEIDALSVVTDNDNAIFVDENNNILMW